ncbi:MAG: hypothetical protein AB7F94_19660, partial [Nitrospira sp.]
MSVPILPGNARRPYQTHHFAAPHSIVKSLAWSDWLLLMAIVAFFFEGSIRKWLLTADSPLRYACVFAKEALILTSVLLSGFKIKGPVARFWSYFLTGPVVFVVVGCLIGAFQELNYVGAAMTLRALLVLPV